MLRGKLKLPFALLLGLIPACSGNGCSSCGGLTPLPGGFPTNERIENAAAVRLTNEGINFLGDNLGTLASQVLGGGVTTFPVPETSGSIPIPLLPDPDYTVCPGGPDAGATPPKCIAEIDLATADVGIATVGPHNLEIAGTIPLRLQDLPLDTDLGNVNITLTGNQACPGDDAQFANVGVSIKISVESDLDTTHARYGYSRLRIESVQISENDIESALRLNCGGFLGTILDAVKGLVVGQLFGSLQDTLVTTVEEQLCQKSNPAVSPACPTGTNDVDGICRYGTNADAECVSMVLGVDGNADLGGLLAGISPGTKGGLDFLLAAGGPSQRDDGSGFTWGDLNPIGGGATLGMFGGVLPQPKSSCVPLANLPKPANLQIPPELIDDSILTGWPTDVAGPHVGIGISESFFNYALGGMYDSGLLCVGLSTETIALLNSGTLALLAQSLGDLTLQREPAPIALVLKPRKPPHVDFGNGTNLETDPLIRLSLEEASFDFYVWSSDRFVRFMTATFDIDAPVNLTVTPDGLVPVLDKLAITNGKVENSDLLREDPNLIAASLSSLLAGQVGNLLGSGLPPIDLSGALASLGVQLIIPESVDGQGSPGLRKLTKDGEDYLGIFATLGIAGQNMAMLETEASVAKVDVELAGLRSATATAENLPAITIDASTDADPSVAVEFQARVDGGMWKPWQRSSKFVVRDEILRFQGKHLVEVRSRPVGQAYALDETPVELEVLIDKVAPEIGVELPEDADRVKLDVWDLVSRGETLVRWRFDDDAFGAWIRAEDLTDIPVPAGAEELEIETQDEAGNVGTARQSLIRGHSIGEAGGCGCAVPGSPENTPRWPVGLLGLGLLGLFARRRTQRGTATARAVRSKSFADKLLDSRTRQVAGALATIAVGQSFGGCSCDDDTQSSTGEPPYTCEAPGCVTLDPGLIGSYTSTAVDDAGTLWIAGYLEANWDQPAQFGDLVVGKYDGTSIEWTLVDGVPTEPPVDGAVFNLEGFRGGQTAPGDDVGLWTSIGISPADGRPAVAYYDRTNKALKLARFDGSAWAIETIDDDPAGDMGRYAKLVFDGSNATIAYLATEAVGSGFAVSKVKLAKQNGGSYSFEDAIVDKETPCRPDLCSGGSKCTEEGRCATAGTGCPMCATGEQCLTLDGAAACRVVVASKLDTYPMTTGVYIDVATLPDGGLGLAYYDRIRGTANVAARGANGWEALVVDGGVQPDGSATDVGPAMSLAIDGSGDWHVTYIDGYAESLKYARISGGEVQEVEVIDEGFGIGDVPFADGQHIIGDDSFVHVTPQGTVQVTYQDATVGKLRFATGTPKTGGGHDWSVKVVEADAFAGFFSSQIEVGGALKLVHWGRKLTQAEDGSKLMVGDVIVSSTP